MSTSNSSVIRAEIAALNLNLKRGEALQRLMDNKDFQNVILSGYIHEEGRRILSLKTDPNFQSQTGDWQLNRKLDAIPMFESYLKQVEVQGEMAQADIDEKEADLIEAEASE